MSPIILAVVTAFAVLVLMAKLGIRRFLRYDAVIDVLVSGFLVVVFAGTITGTAAAVVAGAIFSIVLWILKLTMGTERLTRSGWKRSKPKLHWPQMNHPAPPWANRGERHAE